MIHLPDLGSYHIDPDILDYSSYGSWTVSTCNKWKMICIKTGILPKYMRIVVPEAGISGMDK